MSIRTVPRAEIDKLTMRAWSLAVEADANSNKWVSKSEVDGFGLANKASLKLLFAGALKAKGTTSAVRVGDVYAQSKKDVVGIRKVADTKGNKDGAIQPGERKYLNAEEKAVLDLAVLPKRRVSPPAIKNRPK